MSLFDPVEFSLELSSPITEADWDEITDANLDRTDSVLFNTKSGKRVLFMKAKTGKWSQLSGQAAICTVCGRAVNAKQARDWKYCPHCGSNNKEEQLLDQADMVGAENFEAVFGEDESLFEQEAEKNERED